MIERDTVIMSVERIFLVYLGKIAEHDTMKVWVSAFASAVTVAIRNCHAGVHANEDPA